MRFRIPVLVLEQESWGSADLYVQAIERDVRRQQQLMIFCNTVQSCRCVLAPPDSFPSYTVRLSPFLGMNIIDYNVENELPCFFSIAGTHIIFPLFAFQVHKVVCYKNRLAPWFCEFVRSPPVAFVYWCRSAANPVVKACNIGFRSFHMYTPWCLQYLHNTAYPGECKPCLSNDQIITGSFRSSALGCSKRHCW